MKVFISSVIKDYEPYRAVVERAIRTLDHTPIRAEDFGATPDSPQRVCLAGVRGSDAVVLVMGERYGWKQESGLSATHEEYREAKEQRPILVFIQQGVTPEPDQTAFIQEVQSWNMGQFTENFHSPDDLYQGTIRALHHLDMSQAIGQVDEQEIVTRATGLVPNQPSSSLCLVVAGGPYRQVLRPSELEDKQRQIALEKEMVYGGIPLMGRSQGVETRVQSDALIMEQQRTSVLVNQTGTVRIIQDALYDTGRNHMGFRVIVEEEITERIERALRLTNWLLDQVDPSHRLTHVAPVAALIQVGYAGWLTRAEVDRSPGGVQSIRLPSGRGDEPIIAHLSPAHRNRAALAFKTQELATDLMVLLRRQLEP